MYTRVFSIKVSVSRKIIDLFNFPQIYYTHNALSMYVRGYLGN